MKPDSHDPEFVGREDVFKYLAVHGYEKFQMDKEGRLADGTRPWIKDATRKDSDPDYQRLTMLQRETLSGLRRLTGLHGKWPSNNPTVVARGLCTLPKERTSVSRAIRKLVVSGLVALSNVELGSLEVREVREESGTAPQPEDRTRTESALSPEVERYLSAEES